MLLLAALLSHRSRRAQIRPLDALRYITRTKVN
jgi:hypothetical protein